jgi:Lecithin retinol acyltransferase
MLPRLSIGLVWFKCRPHPATAIDQAAGPSLEPAAGTHLVTSRRGYTHHGIYVGHGMVVHYAGLSRLLKSGPVEEVTMRRFSVGRPVRMIEHCESQYSLREIVRRARSRLGENKYHVLENNCEHFCNWCISGRSRSIQVERPEAITLRALVRVAKCANQLPIVFGMLLALVGRVVPTG